MSAVKKVRHRQFQPKPKLPAVVQMRKTEEFLKETEKRASKLIRLVWLAIKKAGGRIEFSQAAYKEAMEAPSNERVFGIEVDDEGAGYAMVFQDAEGKRLPASERGSSIIITDK